MKIATQDNMTAIPAVTSIPSQTPVTLLPGASTSAASSSSPLGGLSFGDIVDALNPLQHIPVVSGIYRAATGSSISTTSQLAGDTLYGGLVGGAAISFASSLANVALKQVSGEDIGQHIVATVSAAASSVTSGTATGNTQTVTKLSPQGSPLLAAQTIASNNTDLATQAATAAQAILHNGLNPERVNAQYQRTRALDSANKSLLKAAG